VTIRVKDIAQTNKKELKSFTYSKNYSGSKGEKK
jgi:hypothetical protein